VKNKEGRHNRFALRKFCIEATLVLAQVKAENEAIFQEAIIVRPQVPATRLSGFRQHAEEGIRETAGIKQKR
jgi:hypothetical protein